MEMVPYIMNNIIDLNGTGEMNNKFDFSNSSIKTQVNEKLISQHKNIS